MILVGGIVIEINTQSPKKSYFSCKIKKEMEIVFYKCLYCCFFVLKWTLFASFRMKNYEGGWKSHAIKKRPTATLIRARNYSSQKKTLKCEIHVKWANIK